MKILDLWCGSGNNENNIYSEFHTTTGIDIDPKNIETCKKKFPKHSFLLVSGEALPFENESFDMIHSLDVLEHVDNLEKTLEEATRVLKKSGEFLIEVPHAKTEDILLKIKPQYWEQVHHVRKFQEGELEAIMWKLWYSLKVFQRVKHFNFVGLKFYFRFSDIVNQKWEMHISPLLQWCFRITHLPYFFFYKIFQKHFDNWLPKSMHFVFIKN